MTAGDTAEVVALRRENAALRAELDEYRRQDADRIAAANNAEPWLRIKARVRVRSAEARVLLLLLEHAGMPISNERVCQRITPNWRNCADLDGLARVSLSRLRKGLREAGLVARIETVRHVGYVMPTADAAGLRAALLADGAQA